LGYLPALSLLKFNNTSFGEVESEGYRTSDDDIYVVDTWVRRLERLELRYEYSRLSEEDEDTSFEAFTRSLGMLPPEAVSDAWGASTYAAGIVYVDKDGIPQEGEPPLEVFVILSEDVIRTAKLVSDNVPHQSKVTDIVNVASSGEAREYLQRFSSAQSLRSQERDLERKTRVGRFPRTTKEVVSAYFDGPTLIAVAWATRASSLDQIRGDGGSVGFDILIDPAFQSMGLGKRLLCDAMSHLIEVTKEFADSIHIEVVVVSPILRKYLKKLGFKWKVRIPQLSNSVEMTIALSDTEKIRTMCEGLQKIR